MPHPGPRSKNTPAYDPSRRAYRLRKPGGKGWYPTLLSGVADTEENFQRACEIARKYILPRPIDTPDFIADLIDNWLSHYSYVPQDGVYQWAMSIKRICGADLLSGIEAGYLRKFRIKLQELKYTRYRQKTSTPYSQTTISKYGKLLTEILSWGNEQNYFVAPKKWADPGWPTPKVGLKHVPFDRIATMLDALHRPPRSTRACEKCGNVFPKLGFHLHVRACSGKNYQPKIPRKYRVASDRPHPCYWLVRFALGCGGRPDEICLLKWENIDFALKICTLPEIKHKTGESTGETRKLYPTDDAMEILGHLQNSSDYVFLNEHQRPYKPAGVRQALRIHCGITGLYALRHTFAMGALLQGLDVTEVQKLLGHRDVKTTMNYLRVLDPQAVQAARRLAAPHALADAVRERLGLSTAGGDGRPGAPALRAIPAESAAGRATRKHRKAE